MRKYITAGICVLLAVAISLPAAPAWRKKQPEPRRIPRGAHEINAML